MYELISIYSLVSYFKKASINHFSRCFLVQADNIDKLFLQHMQVKETDVVILEFAFLAHGGAVLKMAARNLQNVISRLLINVWL